MEEDIGRRPQYLYSMSRPGNWCELTTEEYARVRAIKGVRRARVNRGELLSCW